MSKVKKDKLVDLIKNKYNSVLEDKIIFLDFLVDFGHDKYNSVSEK